MERFRAAGSGGACVRPAEAKAEKEEGESADECEGADDCADNVARGRVGLSLEIMKCGRRDANGCGTRTCTWRRVNGGESGR